MTGERRAGADPPGNLILGNSLGFSIMAFASYFDVFSHRYWFVNVDPWYNPAHLLLYGGILVLVAVTFRWRGVGGPAVKVSWLGIAMVVAAAVSNEVWHRVLLFGNPLPEPFPIEPPHALLAVGIAVFGAAALLYPLGVRAIGRKERLAISFLAGSLWLIVAGSFFYVGAAYGTSAAYFLGVAFASFTSSFFLRYASGLTRRFGYASLSYAWFLSVNYVFFATLQDGLPVGILLVLPVDFLLVRSVTASNWKWPRLVAFAALALLYGIVYFPLLPIDITLGANLFLAASMSGVALAWLSERTSLRALRRQTAQNLSQKRQILTA